MRWRSAGSIFSMRAAADFNPPLRPKATAAGFLRRLSGTTLLATAGGLSPVSAWTNWNAETFGSVERCRFLLKRLGIVQVSHGFRAKRVVLFSALWQT